MPWRRRSDTSGQTREHSLVGAWLPKRVCLEGVALFIILLRSDSLAPDEYCTLCLQRPLPCVQSSAWIGPSCCRAQRRDPCVSVLNQALFCLLGSAKGLSSGCWQQSRPVPESSEAGLWRAGHGHDPSCAARGLGVFLGLFLPCCRASCLAC